MPGKGGSGAKILALAKNHIGQSYVPGFQVPKNNARWAGPWGSARSRSFQ